MKIKKVKINNRKKSLEIETQKGVFSLPYSRLSLKPTSKDKIISAFIDKELGQEALTYILASGKEDSIHLDAFLDYNQDPDFIRQITLHKLTTQALTLIKKSDVSRHEITRRLKTSPSQLYRLLDPSNYKKSMGEMIKLLYVLGCHIEFNITKKVA